jgi:hypothetical protein
MWLEVERRSLMGCVMLFNVGEPFVGEGFGGKEPGLREFPAESVSFWL